MVRTQIQLPEALYHRLKRLAERQETSLADVIRRASERELAAHPEIDTAPDVWTPPPARRHGIRSAVPIEEWRLLANEPEGRVRSRSPRGSKR